SVCAPAIIQNPEKRMTAIAPNTIRFMVVSVSTSPNPKCEVSPRTALAQVPSQQPFAEQECCQSHASQKNPEGHLISPQRNHCRVPRALARNRALLMKSPATPLGTLDPYRKNGCQPERAAGEGRGKYRHDRQTKSDKGADHRHQLHVAKSHSFHASRPQVDRAGAVQKGRTDHCTQNRVHERKQSG